MFNIWSSYLDSVRLGLQAQQVIALRMLRLSEGGPGAWVEAQRMVGEKVLATWAAQLAAGQALALGGAAVNSRAMKPFLRAVRANRRRLTRKGAGRRRSK